MIHIHDLINGWSEWQETSRQNSIACAVRAVALDEANPEAHFAMSVVMLWSRNYDEALREAERAIALDPNHCGAHAELGMVLHYAGRSAEALPCFDRAEALDPYYLETILHFRAQALYALGHYAEAAESSKRRILSVPKTDASRVLLAASYGQMGRIDETREAWREALAMNPAYSLEHRRKVLPYKNPADFESVVDGLRKAGLVEQGREL